MRSIELRNRRLPGKAQNYYVVCREEGDPWEEPVVTEAAMKLLETLTKAQVPARGSSAMGLDGTTYEISFGDWFGGSRFWWWESAPPGWEVLSDAVLALNHWAKRY
jgi:hypothetical protein